MLKVEFSLPSLWRGPFGFSFQLKTCVTESLVLQKTACYATGAVRKFFLIERRNSYPAGWLWHQVRERPILHLILKIIGKFCLLFQVMSPENLLFQKSNSPAFVAIIFSDLSDVVQTMPLFGDLTPGCQCPFWSEMSKLSTILQM